MRRTILFLLCLTLPSFSALSQTTYDLARLYEVLQAQNEDMKQANLNMLLAQVDVKDAKNAFIPTLSFDAGHSYNLGLAFDQISGQLITGNRWSNNANANVSTRTTLFQGFSRRNQVKSSLLNLESREVQQSQMKQSVKLDLLSKYFDATAFYSLYEASLKQLQFAKEQLQQEQTKFELEANTLVDVAQAESQVANNELNSIVNKSSLNNSLIAIKQLLGIPYSDSIAIELPQQELSSFALLDTLTSLDADPAIHLAELTVQRSELNLKNAKSTYYPSISFYGGYGTNYSSERTDYITGKFMPFGDQVNQNRSLNFGLSLSVPIFDAFKTKNNISRSKLELQVAQSELTKTKAERTKILLVAKQEYARSVKEFQVLQVQYNALEKNYLALKERYNLGVSNSMDYNKALLDYNIAEFNVIKARYTVLYNLEVISLLKNDSQHRSAIR